MYTHRTDENHGFQIKLLAGVMLMLTWCGVWSRGSGHRRSWEREWVCSMRRPQQRASPTASPTACHFAAKRLVHPLHGIPHINTAGCVAAWLQNATRDSSCSNCLFDKKLIYLWVISCFGGQSFATGEKWKQENWTSWKEAGKGENVKYNSVFEMPSFLKRI